MLNRVGYTPEVNHGVLMEMAEHKKDLERKTKPIADTLRSYQDLPPVCLLPFVFFFFFFLVMEYIANSLVCLQFSSGQSSSCTGYRRQKEAVCSCREVP
jgi:hypothetical protein